MCWDVQTSTRLHKERGERLLLAPVSQVSCAKMEGGAGEGGPCHEYEDIDYEGKHREDAWKKLIALITRQNREFRSSGR